MKISCRKFMMGLIPLSFLGMAKYREKKTLLESEGETMTITPFLRRAEMSSCKGKEKGVGLMVFSEGVCKNAIAYPRSMMVKTHLSIVIFR